MLFGIAAPSKQCHHAVRKKLGAVARPLEGVCSCSSAHSLATSASPVAASLCALVATQALQHEAVRGSAQTMQRSHEKVVGLLDAIKTTHHDRPLLHLDPLLRATALAQCTLTENALLYALVCSGAGLSFAEEAECAAYRETVRCAILSHSSSMDAPKLVAELVHALPTTVALELWGVAVQMGLSPTESVVAAFADQLASAVGPVRPAYRVVALGILEALDCRVAHSGASQTSIAVSAGVMTKRLLISLKTIADWNLVEDCSRFLLERCSALRTADVVACALIALGHVSDCMEQLDPRQRDFAATLIQSCKELFLSMPSRSLSDTTYSKLAEALRVALKILHKARDYEAIVELWEECPDMGHAWHIPDALRELHHPVEAMHAMGAFFQALRGSFATRVPSPIRKAALKIAEDVGMAVPPHQFLDAIQNIASWQLSSIPMSLLLEHACLGLVWRLQKHQDVPYEEVWKIVVRLLLSKRVEPTPALLQTLIFTVVEISSDRSFVEMIKGLTSASPGLTKHYAVAVRALMDKAVTKSKISSFLDAFQSTLPTCVDAPLLNMLKREPLE